MTSNKLTYWVDRDVWNLITPWAVRRALRRTGAYDQMEQLSTHRKFHFCSHRNFRGFFPKWKVPSKKVVPFSRLERSEWKFVYHLQVSCDSYHFHVVTRIQSNAARQSGN